MLPRRAAIPLAAVLAVAGLAACSPTPAPTPTPTGFTSEEEAFAAAEETYRAYVEEINAYNSGDPDADPLRYLTGNLRQTEAELYQQSREAGLKWNGDLKIISISHGGITIASGAADVHLTVCMDSSEWRILNADGKDTTPQDTPTRYFTDVELSTINHTDLVIVDMVPDFEVSQC